jgi:hypothetical protein
MLGGAKMSSELLLQLIQTAAVVVGIVFGLVQLRQLREQREIQAGVELLRPLQASETAETILLIHSLPDSLDGKQLRLRLGKEFGSVLSLLALFESLGPLVARGHVPIDMYAEFYRGPTILCWRKLRGYVEEQRLAGWSSLYEWVQWLAERMEERSASVLDIPAFEQFESWKTSSDYEKLSKRRRPL